MTYLSDDAQLIQRLLPAQAQPPDDADDLFVLYAVLLRAKGEAVTPADVHNAWVAWMQTREPDHPALVPYGELEPDVKKEDWPYAQAIQAAARMQLKLGN